VGGYKYTSFVEREIAGFVRILQALQNALK
jgi:hypothetical protein